jgi:hypothetical protein
LGAKKVKNFFKNARLGKVSFNKNDVGGIEAREYFEPPKTYVCT